MALYKIKIITNLQIKRVESDWNIYQLKTGYYIFTFLCVSCINTAYRQWGIHRTPFHPPTYQQGGVKFTNLCYQSFLFYRLQYAMNLFTMLQFYCMSIFPMSQNYIYYLLTYYLLFFFLLFNNRYLTNVPCQTSIVCFT